ncbi:hypothetical protein ABPG72_005186 [Tetrahymena utriculariae]
MTSLVEELPLLNQMSDSHSNASIGSNSNISINPPQTLPFQKKEQWSKLYKEHLSAIALRTYTNIEDFFDSFDKFLHVLKIKQNLQVLRVFYEQLDEADQKYFVNEFLPSLATRALDLETLFLNSPVKILKQYDSTPSIFTKRQISSVLANMFFGTIDYSKYRTLIQWYDGPYRIETKIEKIKCLYNYFKRILTASEEHLNLFIIIQRLQYVNQNNYKVPPTLNSNIKIFTDKRIEDFLQSQHIHIDFANQCIGGGVLDTGRVQEEIMFVTNPELLICCQICECIEDKEGILITGAERYSSYTGYSQTFAFEDNFIDPRGIDTQRNCRQTAIVAIDALFFHEHILALQYQPKMIFRELIKALTGFQITDYTPKGHQIVTGNWGCGSFHGDVQLKFIIQWIACSMQERDMIYCTFGNEHLTDIQKIVNILKGQSTEKVIKAIKNYKDSSEKFSVFQYIQKFFGNSH